MQYDGVRSSLDSVSIKKAADCELDVRATGTPPRRFLHAEDRCLIRYGPQLTLGINSIGTFRIRDDTTTNIRFQITTTGIVASGQDNTQQLGTGSNRWSEVFAANGHDPD